MRRADADARAIANFIAGVENVQDVEPKLGPRAKAEIELKEIMEVKDFDLDKASAQVKKIEDLKMEILRI